jgi:hypothetical protein
VSFSQRVIPDFESTGLLPAGIHWASWEEIVKRYGNNSHRKRLLEGLERAIAAFAAAGCRILYLDGSFVTEKQFPADYDGCWDAAGVTVRLLDPAPCRFFQFASCPKGEVFWRILPNTFARGKVGAAPNISGLLPNG